MRHYFKDDGKHTSLVNIMNENTPIITKPQQYINVN